MVSSCINFNEKLNKSYLKIILPKPHFLLRMEYVNICTALNSNKTCTALVLKVYKCTFQYMWIYSKYVEYILIYNEFCYNLKQFNLRLIMVGSLITQVLTSSVNGNINLVLQEGNQHTSLNVWNDNNSVLQWQIQCSITLVHRKFSSTLQ